MAKGHIRARGPGAWELKYDVGADPATGGRLVKYKTVRGQKRDAQRELRAILTAIDNDTYFDASKITTAAWLAQWLDDASNKVAPRTLQRYREIVDLHLIPAIGSVPLAKLAPVHIQKHYHHRVLSLALKRARALRMIHANPADDTAPPSAVRLALGMGRDSSALVFARIDGYPIQPDSVTKMFARIVRRAKIRPISFHGLRHTHATDLLRAGVHPKIVSERLGHATIAITMDTYSHAIPGLQEDAAQRIDAALRSAILGT